MRHRDITCSRNTGVDCDPQKKPLSVGTCYIQDCPQVVDNFGVDWSGSGSSSNEMLNEINVLTDIKPPPKHSTTRAQPSNHNDGNHIVEGDFHYHNNIENIDHSPGSRVHVDDFYYDYNFINFHEDLSDDFDNVGNDSEDDRQETKPTSNVEGNAHMGTTKAPTATSATSTVSKANADDFEEAVDTTQDNMEDNENEATKDSENFDDFLSKDSLLPVSTTRSPPLSPTQHSQTQKERDDSLRWPENISTMPSVELTQDVKHGVQSKNNEGRFTKENPPDTVTHRHAAFTPGYQTIINTVVSTAISALQTQAYDGHEFDYKDLTPLSPNVFSEQDGTEGPDLGPETVTTEVQRDDSDSGIPQTTSQPLIFALTTESSGNFNTTYVTSQYSWQTDHDLRSVSLPALEKPTPAPLPFLQNSGIQKGSNDSASTGIEIIPPTDLAGATQPLPTDFLPAAGKHKPTDPTFTERTGTDSSSQGPSLDLADFDYSETVSPTMVWSSSNQLPPNTTAPQQSTTLSLHREPLTPPTHPPVLWPVQTSASTKVPTAAHWVAGNWSAVSLHDLSPPLTRLMSVSVFYHATHVTFCSHTF